MNLELLNIVTYILAGLSIAMAITAVILFFKLKLVRTVKELTGKTSVKIRNSKQSFAVQPSGNKKEDDDEGFDETIALVADENTYADFKIIKSIIYVNTAEVLN